MAACLLSHFAGNKNLSLFGKMRTSSHHHKWITSVGRRYASPHHTTCHVCNLLVHLSLHSCENQWSFLNGNWLLNHVSFALFFFTKQSGGNYDALQFCITYLPICLASSSPSSAVLGFCPFHLVFTVLNFCRVSWSEIQKVFMWSLGLFIRSCG